MGKSEEMLRMERDMNEQPELKEKLDAEFKRIAEAGEAQCDGEVMVKAAAVLGYSITLEELERATAAVQELDTDEMIAVAGGVFGNDGADEKGHEIWCLSAWHCYATTMHTKTQDKRVACWKDFICMKFSKRDSEELKF